MDYYQYDPDQENDQDYPDEADQTEPPPFIDIVDETHLYTKPEDRPKFPQHSSPTVNNNDITFGEPEAGGGNRGSSKPGFFNSASSIDSRSNLLASAVLLVLVERFLVWKTTITRSPESILTDAPDWLYAAVMWGRWIRSTKNKSNCLIKKQYLK